ncbi:hypothetical protein [Conexibacter arvalis]|uniref:Uncharacterized protein n=1 Tax=Conexibacter arvalis TaxID=912552 RepID=A0A840ICQ8_9ACTN|nr:hypothetical protein [Conexibacter arvalis]MBB4662125.1 hypothetical protein [Conexibacter arvalis]
MPTTDTRRSSARRWLVGALAAAGAIAAFAPAASAAPAFDFAPGSATVQLLDSDGNPQQQAGAHPNLRVAFDLTTREPDGAGNVVPTESLKDVDTWLPPGILGNLNAVPVCNGTARDTPTCPMETAVGEAVLRLALTPVPPSGVVPLPVLVHRLPAPKGVAARLGFWLINISVVIDVRVTPDGGYRLVSNVKGISTAAAVYGQQLTLWGVPADHNGPGPLTSGSGRSYGGRGSGARKPFMWAPTRCGVPLDAKIAIRSWQQPERTVSTAARITDGLTGCDQLPFAPTLDVRPDNSVAGQPSGYAIDLGLGQREGPDELIASQLKDATVTLPEGVAISPGRARGLDVCTDEQLGEGRAEAEACPPASRIGEVRIDSPLLPDPLTGVVYMGQQRSQDPASGEMYRMFMVAHDPSSGVRIKLRGHIKADPATGQLATTFADNPELPFSRLSLRLDGGDRAALVNPSTCGVKEATLAATGWAGSSPSSSSTFAIDQGCAPAGFGPLLAAGTLNPAAGEFSPFALTVARQDGEQQLKAIKSVRLPEGLLGKVSSVPLCGEAQAAAGTCPESSRIGHVQIATGAGGSPIWVPEPGKAPTGVYLTGPHGGAPYGMSIVVPAQAGPFDLGTVVLRSALHIDRHTAAITAETDDLPTILGGTPLNIREVRLILDRPGFMFNPTSCEAKSIDVQVRSVADVVANLRNRFQVGDCAALPFTPRVGLRVGKKGRTRPRITVPFKTVVQMTPGQANLRSVRVNLPRNINARLPVINNNACPLPDYEAGKCPERLAVGSATAVTPVLRDPLRGKVYFVRNPARRIPDLVVALRGEVDFDLVGKVSIPRNLTLATTFDTVPDVPITKFTLNLVAGRNGPIGTIGNLCAKSVRRGMNAKLAILGQSGRAISRSQKIRIFGCRGVKAEARGKKGKAHAKRGAAKK